LIDPQIAFLVSVGHSVSESQYLGTVADFEAADLPVVIEKRDPEVFAALTYLMPTAIALYLLKPYSEKFLSKLAEDNYDSCKSALKKLWATCLSEDRRLHQKLIGTREKISDTTLGIQLSFLAKTVDGQAFRLLFPNGISTSEFLAAVTQFYSLINDHDQNPESSVLGQQATPQFGRARQRVLTWIPTSTRLVEVDVMESARRKMLITIEIPQSDKRTERGFPLR
jgi:hypothetical protein